MGSHHADRVAAGAALCRRLEDGLVRAGLTKTQLAARTELGRTTVQAAFKSDGPPPSASTVAALARALRLPLGELLVLQRTATGAAGPGAGGDEELGKPISQWDPHDLEVHPTGTATRGSGTRFGRAELPGYVERAHDRALADVVQRAAEGRSGMLVLVGSSSTGKTRACWEAVQALALQGWRLWHPYDPVRAEALLGGLDRVGPRTVVWLNEAQHYLGDAQAGELIAAALHTLLGLPGRQPVLVLGTLWPEYADRYSGLPHPGGPDPHSRVRELLTGRTMTVPDSFDREALQAATALAQGGDLALADALTRVGAHGRVTQDLAGAPELLRRYEQGTPAVRALQEAAMDARRLGVGLHLPQGFLIDAATDYLTDQDYDQLTDDWAEAAFADLARLVHGKQAPLRRTRLPRTARRGPGMEGPGAGPAGTAGPLFRLADYLEQHGRLGRRRLCPPASFWRAAHSHLTRCDDLNNLAEAAKSRCRLQWAHHLWRRAADAGDPSALTALAQMRKEAGDEEGAESLYRQAADAGDARALTVLAKMRQEIGDGEGAQSLYRQAADAGDARALSTLAKIQEKAGDRESAESLARQAFDAGFIFALTELARTRAEAGDVEGAEALARQAFDAGDPSALTTLAGIRFQAGDVEGSEDFARQVADAGDSWPLVALANMREEAGDLEGAESLIRRTGRTGPMLTLARMREQAGDRERAEALARLAADAGAPEALTVLADMRLKAGDWENAEALVQQAADADDCFPLIVLARIRERAGDREGAEALARQAADAGDPSGLTRLAQMRKEAGDQDSAEDLYRQGADAGDVLGPGSDRWPNGLDPNGSPASPWQ